MTDSLPRSPRALRRNAALLVIVAGLGAVALHAAGHGVLASPHRWNLQSWQQLVHRHGVPIAALVIVRLLALGACVYLGGLGVATILLARSDSHLLRRALATATPRLLRPALGVVAGLTFATPAYAAGSSTPPVMVRVTTTTTTATPTSPPPTMRRVGDATLPTSTSTTPPLSTTTATTVPSPAAEPAATPDTIEHADLWTVDRGDHFWHIAEATLFVRLGRMPSLDETDAYWRVLVEANRAQLVDTDNPDLIFVGQEITLPPHR